MTEEQRVGDRHEGRPTRGPSTHTQFNRFQRTLLAVLSGATVLILVSGLSAFWQLGEAAGFKPRKAIRQEAQETEQQQSGHKKVKSATCLLTGVETSKRSTSVARSLELKVDLSVPRYAQECEATVTIDAPTFDLGKEPEQTVSIVSPPRSDVRRWLLEPEKVGRWQIAVETTEDRDLVPLPVVVTTPIGLTAPWAQIGAIAGVVSTVALGALGLLLRRE